MPWIRVDAPDFRLRDRFVYLPVAQASANHLILLSVREKWENVFLVAVSEGGNVYAAAPIRCRLQRHPDDVRVIDTLDRTNFGRIRSRTR
jgi:hypothetical protein